MTARPDMGIDGEPELRFQPAVDMATGRLLGFEALLRWNDPVRGVLAPDVILAWAEANGHLTALNAWVLFEACSRAVEWESSLQVAVNCSASELRSRKASLAVVFALEQSGLNPDRLTIEVTETAVCDNVAIGELYALSKLGVQLAVDNIGPEWANAVLPQHVGINTVKIDRTLVGGLEDVDGTNRAIVDTLVSVIHSKGICPVAGGIETPGQVAILRELRADVGQGYFFAPPLSADEAKSLTVTARRSLFPMLHSVLDEQRMSAPFELAVEPGPNAECVHDRDVPHAAAFGDITREARAVSGEDGAAGRRNRLPSPFRRGRHSSS
jgi:EAL domain-containing protein (putative c-di-GMP-specific phosphodiesterase class I)